MMYRDFDTLTEKEKYKITKGSVIPRPIAWITTSSTNATTNIAPFSYFNMISPEHLIVSILRRDGALKDTAYNLRENKEAVVHIVHQALLELVAQSGKELAYGVNEIDATQVTFISSEKVAVQAIEEAPIRFEVQLKEHYPLAEKAVIVSDIFILKILAVHLAEEVYDVEKGYVLSETLNPLARLGGPEYATIVKIPDYKREK